MEILYNTYYLQIELAGTNYTIMFQLDDDDRHTWTKHRLAIQEKIGSKEIRIHTFPSMDSHIKFFLQKNMHNLEACSFYSQPITKKIQ